MDKGFKIRVELHFIWAFPLVEAVGLSAHTAQALSHGPVSLPAGRQALRSLTQKTYELTRNFTVY